MIKFLDEIYRGFRLGYRQDYYPHTSLSRFMFVAAWRSSLEDRWTEGCMLLDAVEQVVPHAKACIDYNYKREAWEAEHGRKITLEEMVNLGPNLDGSKIKGAGDGGTVNRKN